MKTLKLTDIDDVKAEDVQPGMILAEGIVVTVEKQDGKGNRRDIYFFHTAADGHVGWAYGGKTVQVYARLNEALTEALVATAKAS